MNNEIRVAFRLNREDYANKIVGEKGLEYIQQNPNKSRVYKKAITNMTQVLSEPTNQETEWDEIMNYITSLGTKEVLSRLKSDNANVQGKLSDNDVSRVAELLFKELKNKGIQFTESTEQEVLEEVNGELSNEEVDDLFNM